MSALESLANPLERVAILPQSLNLYSEPVSGSPVWDPTLQYVQNDVVLSSVDLGPYVWPASGTAVPTPVSVRGGSDPSVPGSGWVRLSPISAPNTPFSPDPTAVAAVVPLGAFVFTNGVQAVAGDTRWLVTVQGTAAATANGVAGDCFSLTVTGSNGGTATSWDIPLIVGKASTSFSCSGVVTVGVVIPTGTLTLTGTARGTVGQDITLTALKISCVCLF